MQNKTNTLAIIAFVAVMLFFVPFSGTAGFIMGIIALGQINERKENGRGLAITAIVLGAISIAFWAFYILGVALLGV